MRRNVAAFMDENANHMVGEYPSHLIGEDVHGMSDQDLLDYTRGWLVTSGRLTSDEVDRLHLKIVEGG